MERMPVLFIGHGNPMNAITANPYRTAWQQVARRLPRPQAILSVSAHWLTRGTLVTLADPPATIHDFGGFPAELYAQQYPAPGAPAHARRTIDRIHVAQVQEDHQWGLDHGTWCVLSALYPAADIPVYQLSLDVTRSAADHLAIARELRPLRDEGVLIVGSGNIVHNLRQLMPGATTPPDWAQDFDDWTTRHVNTGDAVALARFENAGTSARLSVPTPDHFLPLVYAMGAAEANPPEWFAEGFDLGSISMRSALWI
jgi:4,5-DOPA dioxygenase extradiol